MREQQVYASLPPAGQPATHYGVIGSMQNFDSNKGDSNNQFLANPYRTKVSASNYRHGLSDDNVSPLFAQFLLSYLTYIVIFLE